MAEDKLGVRTTTRFVVENAELVRIDAERAAEVAREMVSRGFAPPVWNSRYHFFDSTERSANYVLLLDALNFCFWGTPKWTVEYQGEILDGYWALAAALTRAIEEGQPLLEAAYLRNVSAEEMSWVLRGNVEIPLFAARVANAREVGRILLEKYDGSFAKLVNACEGSAVTLAETLKREFPSFDDVTEYKGRLVRFLKRAQICAVDLFGAFAGRSCGHFSDLDQITAFADYKVPQVLRALGVLHYAASLATVVDSSTLLPAGSQGEVEIRAHTIWAVELLRGEILKQGVTARAFEVDWWLWDLGQGTGISMRPYHRTRTIFY